MKLFPRKLTVKVAVKELQKKDTDDQLDFLSESLRVGKLNRSTLKTQLMANSVKEIRKGCAKFKKEGKELTVDGLLEEYRNTPKLVKLCDSVGLFDAWFVQKAEIEIKRYS